MRLRSEDTRDKILDLIGYDIMNKQGTGYCQILIPQNMDTYRKGYEELAKRRAKFAAKKK